MRTGKMKNVWKRIGAFALALVIAAPITGAGPSVAWAADVIPVDPSPGNTNIKDAEVDNGMLETVVLEATDFNGKQIASPSKSGDSWPARLEVGDRLKVAVKAAKDLDKVLKIEGEFQYNTDFFQVISQSDVKSDLLKSKTKNSSRPLKRDLGPVDPDDPTAVADEWTIGWSQTTKRLTANRYPQTEGEDIKAGTNIFIISLRVKEAVNNKIIVQYKAASNGIDDATGDPVEDGSHGITVEGSGTNDLKVQTDPAACTLANNMYGKRNFELSVSGNATEGGNDVLKVSLDENETMKAEIPVSVKKDDGYNGFTLSYLYDSDYLTPDLSSVLTNQASAYISIREITGPVNAEPPTGHAGEKAWRKVTVSVISNTNIKLSGDLMLLTFKVNEANKNRINTSSSTTIYTELVDVVTQSDPANAKYKDKNDSSDPGRIEMNTSIAGGSGNTKEIAVKFVEHLVPFGDVSGDGKVNLIDATMILRYYNQEPNSGLTDDQLKRADVDQSGQVNLVDAVLIIKYYNGDPSVPSLPHSVK